MFIDMVVAAVLILGVSIFSVSPIGIFKSQTGEVLSGVRVRKKITHPSAGISVQPKGV